MAPDRSHFWNERYASDAYAYGTRPNAFIEAQSYRLDPPAKVLELGAGEGRNAVWLARQGHETTVLDYAEGGLRKARRLAEEHDVSIETIHADVTEWMPERQWDAVITTFLHLPPDARPLLYDTIRRSLRPDGLLVAEWFRPEQILRGLPSGGPPSETLMVTTDELEQHFSAEGIELLEEDEVQLEEGTYHRGLAAVVRIVWRNA